eukprot:EG_transcript_59414
MYIIEEHYGGGVHHTIIDAGQHSNVARLLNHSCAPNLLPAVVRVDALQAPYAALFAARPIVAGEELTFRYAGPDARQADCLPCLCGAADCAGFVPYATACLA